MEEHFKINKMNNDFQISEYTMKEEFTSEKEKTRLNLRKNKINEIILSKRKIAYTNESNEEIRKKYIINIEDLENLKKEYITAIPNFIIKVR